jgi:LuxR family maltose regulon positive regulatory protein
MALVARFDLWDYATSVDAFAVAARVAMHLGDQASADVQLNRAMRARALLTSAIPAPAIRARLHLAHVQLAKGDAAATRQLLEEAEAILARRPGLGAAAREVERFRADYAAARLASSGLAPLTQTELRVLALLQTHLTIAEISTRLHITQNTAGTHIKSIYQKLRVNSRGAAIRRGTAVGLLGP